MFKILSLIVLSWIAYRLFLSPTKQIDSAQEFRTEPDEFVEYEEIEDED